MPHLLQFVAGGLLVSAVVVSGGDEQVVQRRFKGTHDGAVRLSIVSALTDWQMKSSSIEGTLEVGSGFPTEAGQIPRSGAVYAKADVRIAVRTLKSVKDDKPLSKGLDEIAYKQLKADNDPEIYVGLRDFVLTQAAAPGEKTPHHYAAVGIVAIAGVTNVVPIALDVLPIEGRKLKLSGQKTLRVSDFGISRDFPGIVCPPRGKELQDEVAVSFEWLVRQDTSNDSRD